MHGFLDDNNANCLTLVRFIMLSSGPQKVVLLGLLPNLEESRSIGLIDSQAPSCSSESVRAVTNDPFS